LPDGLALGCTVWRLHSEHRLNRVAPDDALAADVAAGARALGIEQLALAWRIAGGMPSAERVEEARDLGPLLEGLEVVGETERHTHLLDVPIAARADVQVGLELVTLGLVERAVEVVRDQLHELLAGHHGPWRPTGPSSSSGYTCERNGTRRVSPTLQVSLGEGERAWVKATRRRIGEGISV
jgi:hypothetical protein